MKTMKLKMNDNIILPKSVVLELTYKCNHKCLFCSCPWEAKEEGFYHYEKGRELSFAQWKKVLDKLNLMGVENISISGGECLMKDCLIPLLAYVREKNVFNIDSDIVLISNGLLMNEDYLKAFKKYDVHLSMSLPGLTTFKQHTGKDNAQGVLYWFKRAKEMGLSTTANITVTKINYDELYETIANALIAGADTLLLNRFLIGGRGITYRKELSLNKKQLTSLLDIAEEVLEKANRIGSVGTEYPLCLIDKKKKYKKLHVGSICSAAKDFFVVDPSGIIRTCNHSPKKIGHIFNEDIITDKDYWNRFAKRDYIPNTCVMCNEVNKCDCGCRETANIVYKDFYALDACLNERVI